MKRWTAWLLLWLAVSGIWVGLRLWTLSAEVSAHWTPDYPREELSDTLAKDILADSDYALLLSQTGLGPYAIDTLIALEEEERITAIQDAFFTVPTIVCEKNSPISQEEHVRRNGEIISACPIVALEDGDILITPNSHTFGWRNGHAAIVIDAEKRLTLESAVLGETSAVQSVDKWESYPGFMVFRVASLSPEERKNAAKYASEKLAGVPYGFTMGILSPKYSENGWNETHCAHLIWAVYRQMGIDLDSNGGRIVTPRQLAASPFLELKQVYGLDPQTLWE